MGSASPGGPMAADLRELRRLVGEAAARVQLAHEDMLAHLEPGAEDPVEFAVRRARHQAAGAFESLTAALRASEQELTPLGRVRR
jgi:hypothetical protein